MRAALHDAAIAQDNNLIGIADRGNTMGDQQRGPLLHQFFESSEDALLGIGINARESVVEDQDSRVAHQSPGQSRSLLLASGKSDSSFPDQGGVSHGEAGDLGGYAGCFGGLKDSLIGTVFRTESDVLPQRFAEKISVLRHKTDGAAQGGERPFLDGAPVDQQAAARRFPESGDQRGQGALAASGRADDGQSRTGWDTQVYIMQHRRASRSAIFFPWGCFAPSGIGEIEMSKFNLASHGRFGFLG